jgi:hypothetical protein
MNLPQHLRAPWNSPGDRASGRTGHAEAVTASRSSFSGLFLTIDELEANVLGPVPKNQVPDFTQRLRRIENGGKKDVALFFGEEGVYCQTRLCGHGVVDFPSILPMLAAARPDLNLSIENPTIGSTPTSLPIQIFDPN